MNRRPALADQPLGIFEEAAAASLRAVADTAPPAAARRAATPAGVQKTSVYLPLPVWEKLREIAFYEGHKKLNDLLLEGVDQVLKARRHPSVAELAAKKSA